MSGGTGGADWTGVGDAAGGADPAGCEPPGDGVADAPHAEKINAHVAIRLNRRIRI
jgi:hypothetical protein